MNSGTLRTALLPGPVSPAPRQVRTSTTTTGVPLPRSFTWRNSSSFRCDEAPPATAHQETAAPANRLCQWTFSERLQLAVLSNGKLPASWRGLAGSAGHAAASLSLPKLHDEPSRRRRPPLPPRRQTISPSMSQRQSSTSMPVREGRTTIVRAREHAAC